jgi:hypothetical protein
MLVSRTTHRRAGRPSDESIGNRETGPGAALYARRGGGRKKYNMAVDLATLFLEESLGAAIFKGKG